MTVSSVTATQLWFTAPLQLELREQALPALQAGELLVKTEYSAVSAGTELLLYRGQLPSDMLLDSTLQGMQRQSLYPLQYGYAAVGEVVEVGSDNDVAWLGRRVFAFQPHASHFITKAMQAIPVPGDIEAEAAVFLANMETAINLVQDGQPGIGERVVVVGQGIVGLLLCGVLAQFPLGSLIAVDTLSQRRQLALRLGASDASDPADDTELQFVREKLSDANGSDGADLIYEVSGVPDALNLAVKLSGYTSRIVIGSWYGNKSAPIALGGDAHRNRLQLITSQVSTLAPALIGRWDKQRRFGVAWDMIRKLRPEQLITHKAPLQDAAGLYQKLHTGSAGIVQAVFHHSN